MTISDIYEKYKIPPMLQLHQLRVAGVASIICDNFNKPLDKNSIITACLLHDMGNILKFNFDIFSDEFFAPEGKEYWKKIKEEFREEYGADEDKATHEIANDIGVDGKVKNLIKHVKFSRPNLAVQMDFGKKNLLYADCRVSPYKIVSLKERFEESKQRYVVQKSKYTEDEFKLLTDHVWRLEKQIFEHCKIKPEDITDENVNPLIEKLRDFEI